MSEGIVEFGTCMHCGRRIFFDWKGTFHVGGRIDDCPHPAEQPEEEERAAQP
jgi:hypothetical protein